MQEKKKSSWMLKHPRTYIYIRTFLVTALGALGSLAVASIFSFSTEETINLMVTIGCLLGITLGYTKGLIVILRES